MSGFRQEDILIIMCVLIIIFHLDDPAVIVREEFVRANPGKDSQKSAPQHIYRVESLSRVLFENMDHCASLGHSSFRRP